MVCADAFRFKQATANAISVSDVSTPTDPLNAHFSDWRRLKSAVAWFLRLKDMVFVWSSLRKLFCG